MAFAQIYICPDHGETISVSTHDQIDCQSDEVYSIATCSICNKQVVPKTMKNPIGETILCWRVLTSEEIAADMGYYDDPDTWIHDDQS